VEVATALCRCAGSREVRTGLKKDGLMSMHWLRFVVMGTILGRLALGPAWGKAAQPAPPPSAPAVQAKPSPVKVFVLAGQSNMEGQGIIAGAAKGTLETLVQDPATAPRFRHLVGPDGRWAVRSDVWCAYGNKGCLTAGGFAAGGCIGPELGFGWEVGNYLDHQVLLIKVAVGGTSLAHNWRPPSSGGKVGEWYSNLIAGVKEQVRNLQRDFPGYDGQGCALAGFGWHQGWNDGCVQGDALEYETNLVNFIKDVRRDLGVPGLPFVIGGSGFAGWGQQNSRRLKILEAQQAAAARAEFKGNVKYVETRGFFRPREASPHGFGYHWNGNAETYWLIGAGMGRAMVELLGGPPAPPNPVNPRPKKERKVTARAAPPAAVKLPGLVLDLGGGVTLKLVKIPAGKFLMGSPADEEDRGDNEGPQHEVTISQPFYMGVYELTVAQYERFVKETGCKYARYVNATRDDHPLTGVNWDDAQAFCRWLSRKTGRTVRLPTEAEWEYACRAGTATRYSFGDDAEDLPQYGHFAMDGWDGPPTKSAMFAPVGSFQPNPWGLYDMHGNVNEACLDYLGPYAAGAQADPVGAVPSNRRVSRGGNWHSEPGDCRSAGRGRGIRQALGGPREGFRVVVQAADTK